MLQKFDERNRNLIVNVSGELVHRDQARISPFDSSVQGGAAGGEGLRPYGGRTFRPEQHRAGDCLLEDAGGMAFRRQRADAADVDCVDARHRICFSAAWCRPASASSPSTVMPRSRRRPSLRP